MTLPTGRLSRGKFRFLFLKKSSNRTDTENQHLNALFKENEYFFKLEIIKEAMHEFFNAKNWSTLKNYFIYRVTSALSEGMNNVIKTLKRSAYGYRNMHYFKLKILQRCGYLNSRYIQDPQIQ